MKAIICFSIGSLHMNSFGKEWTSCECGSTKAKWLDPVKGTVVVASKNPDRVKLLGMNNDYIIQAVKQGNLSWEEYRLLHNSATNAENYVFDTQKANCWAVVIGVGRTNDVRWATDQEFKEAFPEQEK